MSDGTFMNDRVAPIHPVIEAYFAAAEGRSAASTGSTERAEKPLSGAQRWSVAVADGTIECYDMPAASRDSRPSLPVVFLPGWGGQLSGFLEVIGSVDSGVRLVYVETREKRSSTVGPRADFSMRTLAADVAAAVTRLRFDDHRYIVFGTSFGASVVAQAVADRVVHPRATVLYDPMPRVPVPRCVLRHATRPARELSGWNIFDTAPSGAGAVYVVNRSRERLMAAAVSACAIRSELLPR